MKLMRKLSISVVVLVMAFFAFFTAKVNATPCITSDLITVKGASVRTTGNAGLRFEANMGTYDTTNVTEYHILLAYGKIDNADSIVVNATLNEKAVKDVEDEAELVDGSYFVTIYNIPTTEYETYVTARAYVVLSDESIVYSSTCTSRNITEVARSAWNDSEAYDDSENLVKTIAAAKKIKITNGTTITYKTDLTDYTIVSGDIIDFARGSYTNDITIGVNNVTLNGVQKGVSMNKSTTRTGYESIINGTITLNHGVTDVVIDGLKIVDENAIHFIGNQNRVKIVNNLFEYSGTNANKFFTDNKGTLSYNSSMYHRNFIIADNAFNSINTTNVCCMIYWLGSGSDINIEDNLFKSASATLNEGSYGIKMNYYENGKTVQIKGNQFDMYDANQLIDLGSGNYSSQTSAPLARVANINIQDNAMSNKSTKTIHGNGIRICYLYEGSSVSIIHNTNFNTSAYYNAILISDGTTANSTNGSTVSVNILYNHFYCDTLTENADVAKPDDRTAVTSRFTRIGLGVKNVTDNPLNITGNYFRNSSSGYAYSSLTASSASKNTNTTGVSTGKVADAATADTNYESYTNPYSNFASGLEDLFD